MPSSRVFSTFTPIRKLTYSLTFYLVALTQYRYYSFGYYLSTASFLVVSLPLALVGIGSSVPYNRIIIGIVR